MSDRKLLELAAKAAGFNGLVYCEFWECMAEFVNEDGGYFDSETCWNPLRDDGDALRLAVKCRLTVAIKDYEVEVFENIDGESLAWPPVGKGDDYEATTRRAIVIAAAKIGGAQP